MLTSITPAQVALKEDIVQRFFRTGCSYLCAEGDAKAHAHLWPICVAYVCRVRLLLSDES